MMDKVAEMQISVGFLDPDLFTSTNISQRSHQVGKAISNAMMNSDYVVGVYCTSHWVTVIICIKFKDSAKQHPPLKFPDLQPVLNWSVSCRFCSQKINLLVFLIVIADHAGPLVQYFLFTKIQSLSVSNWYC
jgi:prepilin signal peptidase PulO-like enzyme (type II secretory pathway)